MNDTAIVFLTDSPSNVYERLFDPGSRDLGCPACPKPRSGDLVVDMRDRWWHAACAGAILGQHTRHDEAREKAKYVWVTPMSPTDLDPKTPEAWDVSAALSKILLGIAQRASQDKDDASFGRWIRGPVMEMWKVFEMLQRKP